MPSLGIAASGYYSAAVTYLLDAVGTSAFAAYSVRKLRSAYAGSAIRVRRSSDSTEQDIGFTGEDLDTASLASFCSGTDGFLSKWYDQSGNGRDAAQTTAGNQPKIVSSGTVATKNSKPTVQWTQASDHEMHATVSFTGNFCTMNAVAYGLSSASGEMRVISLNGGANDHGSGEGGFLGVNFFFPTWIGYHNGTNTGTSLTATNNTLNCLVLVNDNGTEYLRRDSTQTSSVSPTASWSTMTNLQLGRNNSTGETLSGGISEAVVWAAAITGTPQSTLQSNQKAYYSTP